jgi:hypothetical protein
MQLHLTLSLAVTFWYFSEFEVLTAETVGIYNFRDMMPCGSVKFNRIFEAKYRLHLQCPKVSQTSNQHNAESKQSSSMEAMFSFETSVVFHRNARSYM